MATIDLTCENLTTELSGIREWLLRLGELRSDPGIRINSTVFPCVYRFGSCDIFPLWFISYAIQYMKESGDYAIMEEIHLQNIFNSFCRLSGEFTGIIAAYGECGHITAEDTVTAGLFAYVCREYLGMCRFLEMGREAASASVRLKWISDYNLGLCGPFARMEWPPCISALVTGNKSRHRNKGCIDFRAEIIQFILSGIFDIIDTYNKGIAQSYWETTSSAWGSRTVLELIFGIKPGFEGLIVNPCIPDDFENYKIIRYFRNAIYEISVINPGHAASDIKKLVVDNTEYLGNQLPNFADGKTHRVEVTMGSFDG